MKGRDLSSASEGPLLRARGELAKLQPRATQAQRRLEDLTALVKEAKGDHNRLEESQKQARQDARDRRVASVALAAISSKVADLESTAQKLQEAAEPMTSAAEPCSEPVSVLEASQRLEAELARARVVVKEIADRYQPELTRCTLLSLKQVTTMIIVQLLSCMRIRLLVGFTARRAMAKLMGRVDEAAKSTGTVMAGRPHPAGRGTDQAALKAKSHEMGQRGQEKVAALLRTEARRRAATSAWALLRRLATARAGALPIRVGAAEGTSMGVLFDELAGDGAACVPEEPGRDEGHALCASLGSGVLLYIRVVLAGNDSTGPRRFRLEAGRPRPNAVAFLSSEAIRAVDLGRIETIMTAYVMTPYFQGRVPSTSMREVVRDSLDEHAHGRRDNDRRGACPRRRSPTHGPSSGSRKRLRREQGADAPDSTQSGGKESQDEGVVGGGEPGGKEVAASPTSPVPSPPGEPRGCRVGVAVDVWSQSQHKWVVGRVAHLYATDQFDGVFHCQAGSLRVKMPHGHRSLQAQAHLPEVGVRPPALPRQRPQGQGDSPAGPSTREFKLTKWSRCLGNAETAQGQQSIGRAPSQPIEELLAKAARAATRGAAPTSPVVAPNPSPGQQTARHAPLPMPLPRAGRGAQPDKTGGLADEAHWARLRAERPAWPRVAHLQETLLPGWRLAAGPEVVELELAVNSADATWEDQLWQWFEALAKAGVYVDTCAMGPARPGRATGNAHLTPKCTNTTPCVKLRGIGSTVNWFRTTDGRVRLDGAWGQRSILLEMLRKSRSASRTPSPCWQLRRSSTACALAIFAGTLVQVWADGATRARLGTGAPSVADAVAEVFVRQFSGEVRRASDFSATAAANPIRARYEVLSERALQRGGRWMPIADLRGAEEQLFSERIAPLERALASWRPEVAGAWRDCVADLVRRAPVWEGPQAGGLAGSEGGSCRGTSSATTATPPSGSSTTSCEDVGRHSSPCGGASQHEARDVCGPARFKPTVRHSCSRLSGGGLAMLGAEGRSNGVPLPGREAAGGKRWSLAECCDSQSEAESEAETEVLSEGGTSWRKVRPAACGSECSELWEEGCEDSGGQGSQTEPQWRSAQRAVERAHASRVGMKSVSIDAAG
ncbi:unnamed protein product [Prorocentrum cordatum]|uniref:Uncharacterized protein n=1 Tax=Prorocentrum cordatum TaxID=2364126 RepID=A0ABN9RTB2_9DINO|nr:unnamed protein product [Polarella glacialis]